MRHEVESAVRTAIEHVAGVLSDAFGIDIETEDVEKMTAEVMAKVAADDSFWTLLGVVETPEQLEALPVGTVVRLKFGAVVQRYDGDIGAEPGLDPLQVVSGIKWPKVPLPARVLWTPGDEQ
jgi:hypothetical protein